MTSANVAVDVAWQTPQFWLLWIVLCMNVTAGIGVLGQASPMIQEMFPGPHHADRGRKFRRADQPVQHDRAIFLGKHLGLSRPAQYLHDFLRTRHRALRLGSDVRALGSTPLFVAAFCIILSMYGGGFATIPAYLRDVFGTYQVGAIHGRLLTAWSAAGVLGPLLIN